MKKATVRSIEDALAAHAEALNRGQRVRQPLADELGDESLRSLLAVAELMQGALVPVQPRPSFLRNLGKTLVASVRHSRQALAARTRRAALVGAAVLGSLVSVASVVGVIVYVMRQRVRKPYLYPGGR